jgi:hypothetical protein
MPLSQDQIQRIAAALTAKRANNQCAACLMPGTMVLLPETAQLPVAPAPGMLGVGAIPCVALACSNCGHVRFHAVNALGLPDLGNRPR